MVGMLRVLRFKKGRCCLRVFVFFLKNDNNSFIKLRFWSGLNKIIKNVAFF